jgi:hypothetical protein
MANLCAAAPLCAARFLKNVQKNPVLVRALKTLQESREIFVHFWVISLEVCREKKFLYFSVPRLKKGWPPLGYNMQTQGRENDKFTKNILFKNLST